MATRSNAGHTLNGCITNLQRDPLAGLSIRAFDQDPRSPDDPLGQTVTDSDGRYTIRFTEERFKPGGKESGGPDVFIRVLDGDALLGESEVKRNAKKRTSIDLKVDFDPSESRTRGEVKGRIILEHGLPAQRLGLRLYRHGFGGTTTMVGATTTGDDGHYRMPFSLRGSALGLEVRAVGKRGEETPLSMPLHDLNHGEQREINLVAPASLQPLAAEFRRLSADLEPHAGSMTKLADARENDERQDLTVLNRATGWDARLIALAATTERLIADADVNLPREEVYGLLRAGLPSDKLLLAQVKPDVAEQALRTVRDAQIVQLTDRQIEKFKKQFTAFANKVRLSMPAPGSRSTYGEILKASGLSDAAQAKFAPVYLSHEGDSAQLWEKAREAGLTDAQVGRLQLQGKLAFLVGNSEAMTERLMEMRVDDPVQLVEQDFHRPDPWKAEITAVAGDDEQRLAELIPSAYLGEKTEDRLEAYAEDMARKVRLSYPTQVVGRMIEQDNDETFKLGGARGSTATLLKSAAGQGFRLGQTPVAAFLKTHVGVGADMAADELQAAQQHLKTLQRVYQITPSNEAMPVLMSLGMKSAHDVMEYSEAAFVDLYVSMYKKLFGKTGPQAEPRLVYRKARQVSSVTYNLFAIAKKLDTEPQVFGMSASVDVQESVRSELIKEFPTLESLFGSMDFCECEHCRSVLSPAAYLVDLLQFTDAEPEVWANFLERWKDSHDGQEYTEKYKMPYDALIERRPDLPHVPLTCENTHTALPYIDIVNEILEYFVAHGKLEEEAAHDTGDATTAHLLAEPQNVIRRAYDRLREARYPLQLPFDLWIETVRQFCNYFETPLASVLEAFRPTDDLFAPTQPFDRSRIFLESLGFSPAEAAIFTDLDPLGKDKWYELYGYPTVRPAIQNPTNAEHATLTVANADGLEFREGILCTYFDMSADALAAESKTVMAIGTPDSGGAGQTIITLSGVWSAPPEAGDHLVCDTPATLKSAKTLSRRLGVTYKEILEIVQSEFVNPELTKLGVLYKLGVGIHDARFYLDNKGLLSQDPATLLEEDQKLRLEAEAFAEELGRLADTFEMTTGELEAELQAIPFDRVLVLVDPDAGCDFDQTTLRYADGQPADSIAFLRISLFVRLWRKLGWSIEETDRALTAFVPTNAPFETAHLDKRPLQTALIYLAHLNALDKRVRVGKQSRLKLLTLWSDLSTTGMKPLYAQLFLTRSVLKTDPVFDHPLGQCLSSGWIADMASSRTHTVRLENVAPADRLDSALFDSEPKVEVSYDEFQEVQHLSFEGVLSDAEKASLAALSPSPALPALLDAVQVKAREFSLIKGHMLALQGALGLTADEIGCILEDACKSLDTAVLSLPNVSLLYRYDLLARALKMSVRELSALKKLSDLDPFKPLHPDPLTTLDEDYPFTQTLRFIELAEEVKESGVKIEDLEYLLRHRFDDTGKYRPNREGTLDLLKTLADGVRSIRTEHPVPDDPGTMSEEVLRQKLGLALPPDVVERFLAMMNGTVEFTATLTGVASANQLDPEGFADESAVVEVRYNAARQEQKLTLRGVLFDERKADLMARLPKPVSPNPHVESPILGDLLDDVQQQSRSFFEKHLQKRAPSVPPVAGFLDAADFELLFDPSLPLEPDETEQDRVHKRRAKLANAFLPFLQEQLRRQFIVETMMAHTGSDPVLLESLLTDDRLLAGPEPMLRALAATGERGITTTFFASVDGTGASLSTVSLPDADTGVKDRDGNPLKPPGANSARLEGYLEVPTPGVYRFTSTLDKQDAEAELSFDHLPEPVLWNGSAPADNAVLGDKPEEYLELKPGILYRFTLYLRKLNGGEARLRVQGETLPKDRLAQLALYPLAAIEGAERALLVLTKSLQLVQSLGLSEREVRYLLTHAAAFDGLSLSDLPASTGDDSPEGAEARFRQFLRLAGYTRLKRDLAGGTDDLIGIFEANETGDPDEVYSLIAKLTRRDEDTVKATAKALLAPPTFASERPLQRLWEALQVVERFGVRVSSLLEWTHIVGYAATPEQRFEVARDLREAIKARFEPENWQRVAQPIFDKLRQRQRDSLVAHVVHQRGFASMEQLYEYFLIDPGMEPVVQTSRIRLAIASLQLFIQRCLLNLEPQVNPAVINAEQWEWMRRYRVWEANRKIFLFPENWLEPEFRDDKTHLFAELEGALLQGDVSDDLVEDAFLQYLKKLDELARLEIVAIHLEDNDLPAPRTLHVIGRTYSEPHNYFYRRYTHRMWTPWEPVSAEIEGDHLAPVVWRDRLYLFWVTFMDKPHEDAKPGSKTSGDTVANAKIADVMHDVKAAGKKKQMDVQLHWSEYLQGEWSTRESGGFLPVRIVRWIEFFGLKIPFPFPLAVTLGFDPKKVFMHVSKTYGPSGEELGVKVHLKGPEEFKYSFHLAGRNSTPEKTNYVSAPANPYSPSRARATHYSGTGELTVNFKQRITTEPGLEQNSEPLPILQDGDRYALLPCNHNITLGAPEPASLNADDPGGGYAAIESGRSEVASLLKPAFYQDNAHTFFLEPSVTEQTVEEWKEWVTRTPKPDRDWGTSDWREGLALKSWIPRQVPFPDSEDPSHVPIDAGSLINREPEVDWVVNPSTALLFDDVLIGPSGQPGVKFLTTETAGIVGDGWTPVDIHPASALASNTLAVVNDAGTLERAGLNEGAGALNVIGSAGFNSALGQHLKEMNRSGFGAGMSGAGQVGR